MESAEARRARLKALREAAAATDETTMLSTAPDEPLLKFRNYAVKDQKNIEHTTVNAAQASEFVAPVVEPSVVQEVQGEVSLHIFGDSACKCFMPRVLSSPSVHMAGSQAVPGQSLKSTTLNRAAVLGLTGLRETLLVPTCHPYASAGASHNGCQICTFRVLNTLDDRIEFYSGSWQLTLSPVQGDDIIKVAPKKANWDLRRDVAKGLEKLERRTKRALVTIMQEQQQPAVE